MVTKLILIMMIIKEFIIEQIVNIFKLKCNSVFYSRIKHKTSIFLLSKNDSNKISSFNDHCYDFDF